MITNPTALIGKTENEIHDIMNYLKITRYRIDRPGAVYDSKHRPTQIHILLNREGRVSEIRDHSKK